MGAGHYAEIKLWVFVQFSISKTCKDCKFTSPAWFSHYYHRAAMGCAKGWMAQGQEGLSLWFVTPLLSSQLAELFYR